MSRTSDSVRVPIGKPLVVVDLFGPRDLRLGSGIDRFFRLLVAAPPPSLFFIWSFYVPSNPSCFSRSSLRFILARRRSSYSDGPAIPSLVLLAQKHARRGFPRRRRYTCTFVFVIGVDFFVLTNPNALLIVLNNIW